MDLSLLLLDGEDFEILWDEPGPSTEELDLQELEENPKRVSTFVSSGRPTDATYADRLGTALQKGDCLKKLELDFSGWTKWSALEVITFLETSTSLEELTIRSPQADANMTTMRTLSSILEAIASNSTANLQKLALMSLPLQGHKCVSPFCQILQDTQTIQILELDHMTLFRVSDQDMDNMAKAFASNNTLQEISINRLSNKAISLIFLEMSKPYDGPSTLKKLRFANSHEEEEEAGNQVLALIDTKGLSDFLVSPNCRLEQLHLSHVNLDEENSQALLHGLLGNKTLQELGVRHCSVDEAHFARTLQEMTQPHRLKLDCHALTDPATVISALQSNTSITRCELYNLQSPCGTALGNVLSHNDTLQDLHLYWFATTATTMEDDEFQQPPTDNFAQEIQQFARGLRVNRTINTLSFHNFGFDEEGISHLATALYPQPLDESQNTPEDNSNNGTEVVYSLIDLSIVSGPISDDCLLLLAKPLRMPGCRLRSLSVQLEDAPSAFYTKGIVKLFEAVGQNQTLESLQIGSSAVTVQGLDPLVLQNLARALRGATTKLQKLELNVGFNSEVTWRASSRGVVRCIYAAWLASLAGNFSLHSVQFGNMMYGHLSVDDKEFWTAVSFFGLRNRLLSRLQNDEISSVTEALSLAQSMVIDELGTHRPWTLPSWQVESDPARHSLTELSLFFLCMRMMPHLLTEHRGL